MSERMNDTGWWKDFTGMRWHVIERDNGDIVAASESGDTTAAYAETWARWKREHQWSKSTPPKPSKE